MRELNTLQREFWNYLRDINPESNKTPRFLKDGLITGKNRLNVYKNTTRTAHLNALSDTFSCCELILGKRYFSQMANIYFKKYPAKSQNLNQYGDLFPDFCKQWIDNHIEMEDFAYLPDLALLEYIFEQTYYIKDDSLFDFYAFSSLSEKQQQKVTLKLSNSVNLLQSKYPIFEIWDINQNNKTHQEVKFITEPQYICIARNDFKPNIYKIDQPTWTVIKHLQCGVSLEKLNKLNMDKNINAPIDEIIPALLKRKWICNYSLNKCV